MSLCSTFFTFCPSSIWVHILGDTSFLRYALCGTSRSFRASENVFEELQMIKTNCVNLYCALLFLFSKLNGLTLYSAKPTKWSNSLKHHFVGFAFKGLTLTIRMKASFYSLVHRVKCRGAGFPIVEWGMEGTPPHPTIFSTPPPLPPSPAEKHLPY